MVFESQGRLGLFWFHTALRVLMYSLTQFLGLTTNGKWRRLVQLTKLVGKVKPAAVVAISVDTGEQSRAVISQLESQGHDQSALAFLEDTGPRVIDRYGLLNVSYGIARPATFVIDKSGVVRWRFVKRSHQPRATNEANLEALEQIPWSGSLLVGPPVITL